MFKRLILAAFWVSVSFALLVWVLFGQTSFVMAVQDATDKEIGESPSTDRLLAAEKEYNALLESPVPSDYRTARTERGWSAHWKLKVKPGVTLEALTAVQSKQFDEFTRYLKRLIVYSRRQNVIRRICISWALLTVVPVAFLSAKPLAEAFKSYVHGRKGETPVCGETVKVPPSSENPK